MVIRAYKPKSLRQDEDYQWCERCPARLSPTRRAGSTLCPDCFSVVRFEKRAERLGIDLSALGDNEFINRRDHITTEVA